MLAYRAYQELGTDDTDGMRVAEPGDDPPAAGLLSRHGCADGRDIVGAHDLRAGRGGDWLVILPVVFRIALGALLLMLRHRPAWQAAVAVRGLLLCWRSTPRFLRACSPTARSR